ncbi:MAG TPA: CDP-alcohol phosphatidyltransferase family protein, partial [Polyangiales bacterium]|nr:CDP-alcohol phosphatidyltransferase family protein [Polyangiales bacterium]
MPMQDKAASQRNFLEASNSRFEPLLIKTLCEPLLPYIPARLHPSTISFSTHGMVWASALLAAASPMHAPLGRALSLIGAGIGLFLSMIGDCVEGLHARRTHQRTSFGALMGRWLDALVVPLATIGITSAMQLPTWAVVTITIGAAMIYNAQVVLYHHTGEFIHPEPTSGIEA